MTGCFLLHRPIARRPTLAGRSAARGISTGVTSRGTPGRTRQVGQPVFSQVARRIEIPIHLQPARLTVKHPLGKGERRTDPAAARAPLRGREVPRRNEEHGPIPGALILQHPPEGPPPHIQNGPRETPVPRQAPHVQVLHHQNRLGFRQLGGDLVQEVLANVAGCGDATGPGATWPSRSCGRKLFAFAPPLSPDPALLPSSSASARAASNGASKAARPSPEASGPRSAFHPTARQKPPAPHRCPPHPPVPGPPGARDPGRSTSQVRLTNQRSASREMVAERMRAFSD
jgi:hypothetical protein